MTTRQKVPGDTGHARYTYRLRVSSTARTALLAQWDRCRWIWNECVAKSRQVHAHNRAHPHDKRTCGPAQLDKMLTEARSKLPWLRDGASVPQQQTIRDFAKARSKALNNIEKRLPPRQRAGMPRVKKKRQALPTLNYTTRGFRLKDGRLHLAGGIVLTVVWSRELPSTPSSVRVYRDSLGHWYASFIVTTQAQPLPATGAVIGVDWGVKETATTTSDTHDLPHAQHGKTAAHKLARYQRMMARRKPARGQAASKGYRQAQRQTAKLHKKVARQRQDTARKWAKRGHVALTVAADGRSARGWMQGLALFMPARGSDPGREWRDVRGEEPPRAERAVGRDPRPLRENGNLLFALRVALPGVRVTTSEGTVWLHDGSHSWATLTDSGVAYLGGPRDLLAEVERVWDGCREAGEPSVYDFGMTVERHSQWVLCGDPANGPWQVPGSGRSPAAGAAAGR